MNYLLFYEQYVKNKHLKNTCQTNCNCHCHRTENVLQLSNGSNAAEIDCFSIYQTIFENNIFLFLKILKLFF